MSNIDEKARRNFDYRSLTAPTYAPLLALVNEQIEKSPLLQLSIYSSVSNTESDENSDKVVGYPCKDGQCGLVDPDFKAKLVAKAKEHQQAKNADELTS